MGEEQYNGEILKCLTVIFKTGGCSWNRCRMCGYKNERYHGISAEEIIEKIRGQIAWVKAENPDTGYQMLKIFTSGSFFDEKELPIEARMDVARAFRGKLIIAETRTEMISRQDVADFREIIDDGTWERPLYIAMGLETTNDIIREKCIDKGNTFQDFCDAAERIHAEGAGVKTYLLMKPLFLTEKEAIEDMHTSIKEASPYSDMFSMNLCTVQNRTEVERYWKQGAFRPPYLWSALEVLASSDRHIMCDPVGGGYKRGPHNCGKCDKELVQGIRDYSMTGDHELAKALFEYECDCKAEWQFVLDNERSYCMPLTK